MMAVESLVNLGVSAGNAAISAYTLKSQAAVVGIGAFQSLTGKEKATDKKKDNNSKSSDNTNAQLVSSTPNGQSLSDPAITEIPQTLQYVNTLNILVAAGNDGKPDWSNIRAKGAVSAHPRYRLMCLHLLTRAKDQFQWRFICQAQSRRTEENSD